MKIILTDGTELTALTVTGGPRQAQGAKRDALSFVFDASAGLEAIDATFTPANCESVKLVGEDGSENVHTGYTIRVELRKDAEEVTPATAEAEAVYEDRITVTMALRTYAETQIAALQAAVADLQSRGTAEG